MEGLMKKGFARKCDDKGPDGKLGMFDIKIH